MIVVAKISAKNGEEEKMEKTLKDFVPKVKQEQGTLLYIVHRSKNDPTKFLIYEKYTDMDAFVQHSQTPHFKELGGLLAPLISEAPEIDMYDEVAALER
jgi:quinol monooxygenase YgiN